MHANKVAHRDVKPQNVIVTPDGDAKLVDFNISKRFITRSADVLSTRRAKFDQKFFTQICSPCFAAPEVASTNCYSESVDIWGLGIIFLAMNCGMSIFERDDYNTLVKSRVSELIENSGVQLSDGCKHIQELVLSQDPDARPTAAELKSLLSK